MVKLFFALAGTALAEQSCDAPSEGGVLPFPEAPMGGKIEKTMQESIHKWRTKPQHLPKDAPDILMLMIDDSGFGHSSAFGGGINMPSFEKLKSEGISYNAFHNTAMCSPTRASLTTGRNHNRVGAGQIAELGNDWDGYTGVIPKSSATIAEVLRDYGYGTAAFGKDHNTPIDSLGTGPFDRTPTGRGFDYFYGFLAGESSQWEPMLWENDVKIPTPHVKNPEDYHFTEDIAEKAIQWLRRSKALHPDRPVLMYFTPGATHGPHQVATKWADKYKGQFNEGWDAYVDETIEKQKAIGFIPKDTKRPPRPDGMPAWSSLSDKEKAFQARLMEVYAGFLEHTDAQIGKVINEFEALGIRDNTITIFIHSDNGASAEGLGGSIAELNAQNGIPTTFEDHSSVLDTLGGLSALGGPKVDNMYHAAWAWAGDCPFRYTKLVAADFGGTRTPMVISWPKRIKADNTPRSQFHHVTDIVPTLYDILGITAPNVVHGHKQDPMDGISMVYTFDNPTAPGRKKTQYFDIMGSRGVYHEGWFASTFGPRTPWLAKPIDASKWNPEQDEWGLYDTRSDFNLMNNVAKEQPEKLKQMKALFMEEAVENKVLPIGGGLHSILNPQDMPKTTNTKWRLFEGMTRIPESEAPNVHTGNVKAVITADVPNDKINGVLWAIGGYAGGVSLYAVDGILYYEYCALLIRRYNSKIGPVPKGKLQIDMHMTPPTSWAGPTTVSFKINGAQMKDAKIGRTVPLLFTANEGFDMGMDLGSPVSDDYFDKAPFTFEGTNLKAVFEYP